MLQYEQQQRNKGGTKMKPAELIKALQEYTTQFPEMTNRDITLTVSRKHRVNGSFYQYYKMTSWGFKSLTGKGFNIGIEKS